jgi:hypothetical protein
MTTAYKIEVELLLTGGIEAALAKLAGQFSGIDGQIKGLKDSLGGWGPAIAGSGAAIAFAAIPDELVRAEKAGEKLLDVKDKLLRAGINQTEVDRLTAKYWKDVAPQVPTATPDEYLKNWLENRSVYGAERADELTPWSEKLEWLIKNQTGKSEGQGFAIARALEMKGITIRDPESAQKLGDALAQDIIGSGGKLTGDTYQQAAKRGGAAWIDATPEFLSGAFSVIAADLGGDTAGQSLMSLYQTMTGAKRLSKQQYEAMDKAGLIDHSKILGTDRGGMVNLGPGAIKGSEKYTGRDHFDPYKWAQEYIVPAMEGMNEEQKANFLAKISGGNRNVQRQLEMYTDPGFKEQIEKDTEYWRKAHPVDQAYDEAIKRNPKAAREGMGAQAEGMQEAIGEPLAKEAIPYMNSLRDLFTAIGSTASKNPGWVVEAAKMFGAMELLATVPFVAITLGINRVAAALKGLFPGWSPPTTGNAPATSPTQPETTAPRSWGWQPEKQSYSPSLQPSEHPEKATFIAPRQDKTEIHHNVTSINLDGAVLARAVEDRIAQTHELPDSASSSNGVAYPTLNDWNPKDN